VNIVHVVPAFTKGGAERVVVDLANAAVGKGDVVAIVAAFPVPDDLLLKDLRDEVEVRYVARTGRSILAAYLRLLPWMVRNRRWLMSYDIVHCHLTFGSLFGAAAALLRATGGRNRPVIVETYHAVGMQIPKLHRAFHAALLRGRDAVVLMAEDTFWTRFLRRGARGFTTVILNGVRKDIARPSSAEATEYRDSIGIPVGATVVGTVGRLVPARRPDLLIEVFANVARMTDGTVHFLIAGEGSERAAIEAEIDRLGLQDRVHLPGLVLNPAVAFSAIDLYLTLNVGPVTGIAALEAATFGLPIVALQLREDYRPGDADWIWSSTDPGRLSERIVALIRDPEEARALAERQRRHVLACCTVDVMVDAYQDFYTTALARSATPAPIEQKR
jgi:glycosyltransferase involved in cell wall biosynthesis